MHCTALIGSDTAGDLKCVMGLYIRPGSGQMLVAFSLDCASLAVIGWPGAQLILAFGFGLGVELIRALWCSCWGVGSLAFWVCGGTCGKHRAPCSLPVFANLFVVRVCRCFGDRMPGAIHHAVLRLGKLMIGAGSFRLAILRDFSFVCMVGRVKVGISSRGNVALCFWVSGRLITTLTWM